MLKLGFISILLCNLFIIHHSFTLERYAQAALIDAEEDIFESVDSSQSFEPLTAKFCDKVIASYPKKTRQIICDAINNNLKTNFLVLFGSTGVGKSLVSQIIAQNNQKPFLIVRACFVENKTSENLCKVAIQAAQTNSNVIIEGIESFVANRTPQPFTALSDILSILKPHNLLLIGIAYKPDCLLSLQLKIATTLCELKAPKDLLTTVRTINASLTKRKADVESPEVIINIANLVINHDQRDIESIVDIAAMKARLGARTRAQPVIRDANFKAAFEQLNENTQKFKKELESNSLSEGLHLLLSPSIS